MWTNSLMKIRILLSNFVKITIINVIEFRYKSEKANSKLLTEREIEHLRKRLPNINRKDDISICVFNRMLNWRDYFNIIYEILLLACKLRRFKSCSSLLISSAFLYDKAHKGDKRLLDLPQYTQL